MAEVHYFTACSVDGYIADEHHSLTWLLEVPRDGADAIWDGWFEDIGSLVMGATSYLWMIEHEHMLRDPARWRSYYGDRPAWVFTHRTLPRVPGVELSFVEGDVRAVYDEITIRTAGANVWLVGGGDLVGQFYDAGLLDQLTLGMVPVTLGAGAPLLPRRITSSSLTFQRAQLIGQRVHIVLAVRTGERSEAARHR